MIRYRIRAGRDSATTGIFAWAELNAAGTVLQGGVSDVAPLPGPGACELVLASDVVLLQQLSVPAAQRRRLAGNLRYLVEDLVLSDPERLHVVEAALSPRDALCVGIVDREWLQAVLARLAALGLRPLRALAETLLPGPEPGTWTVVWNGKDGFVRTGAVAGFPLDSTEDGSAPMALQLALRKSPPARIVLRAAEPPAWAQALAVPVDLAPAWSWAEVHGEPMLDFLQGEFSLSSGERGWKQRLRRPAMLAASLFFVVCAGIAADWAVKAHERRALLAEMNAVYRETFGANAVVVDPPLQMQRALAELKQRAGEPVAGDFLALLGALSESVLDPATQRLHAMSYQNGRLAVVLAPRDPAAFGALVEALRGKAKIEGHELKIETLESKDAPQLRVIVSGESGRWALARP
jgi:general secretion pathway protein L